MVHFDLPLKKCPPPGKSPHYHSIWHDVYLLRSESWKHCTSYIFTSIRQEWCYCLVSDFDGFVECVLNGGVVCIHKLTLEIEAMLRILNGIIPTIESGSTFLIWPGTNPKTKCRSDQRCRSNNIVKNIIIFNLYKFYLHKSSLFYGSDWIQILSQNQSIVDSVPKHQIGNYIVIFT